MATEKKGITQLFKGMAAAHGPSIKADTSDLEALDVGIDLENRAVAFYEGHLAKARDPMEREFIERMVAEERFHHSALVDMKAYLVDPTAWFTEREHHGLDGA